MANAAKYNKRRWAVPKKRAANYAEERKLKVHKRGPKEGQELTDYEAGIRSGYLQCQTDHAGLYKYKKAINEGLDVDMDAALVIEEKLFGDCFETEDQRNGMTAFVEKRRPDPYQNK